MSGRPIVIVGAGQGGYTTATALRDRGFGGTIMLVDASEDVPYRRPPLSKTYLAGEATRESLAFRPLESYEALGIDLVLGSTAVSIDHGDRRLMLANGSVLGYEHLVVATGSTPRRWGGEGRELSGVHYLQSTTHADALAAALAGATSLVIVGGGFIGMEVASLAAKMGLVVTVLETADRVMARALTSISAENLAQRHRDAGVALRTGVQVAALTGRDGSVTGVRLADGEHHDADVVLVSIGSVPLVAPLSECLTNTAHRAIAVDASLRTADPHISAIGDAIAFPREGRRVRLESVQNATDQARTVAARLTGDEQPYMAVPWFWTEQLGVKVQMAGLIGSADSFAVRGEMASGKFSVFGFDGARFVGAESIGRVADHAAARALLDAGAALTPGQAADEGFDLRSHARAGALIS